MQVHLSIMPSAPGAVLGLSPHRFSVSGYRVAINSAARGDGSFINRRIDQLLTAMRLAGRKSVEIVDACCGDGSLLIAAATRARAQGFVAIEAKGFDAVPEHVEQAWARAAATRDPAIGYTFLVLNAGGHLPIEDRDADIVIGDPGDIELKRIAAKPTAVIARSDEGDLK